MKKLIILLVSLICLNRSLKAQLLNGSKNEFTKADSLRGSNGPSREWWNVLRYDICFTPNYLEKTIKGENQIRFKVVKQIHSNLLQLDLQQPLFLDSVLLDGKLAIKEIENQGNVYFLTMPKLSINETHTLIVYYHGKPKEAVNPPWDGGFVWAKDSLNRPWMSVACQGIGASVWYPCKDYQGDEPDNGATLTTIIADSLVAIANGRLKAVKKLANHQISYTWAVTEPINNYDLIPYIGKYVSIDSSYTGLKGKLSVDLWALDYDKSKMLKHATPEVFKMLKAFEYWFGPYPFYPDGYKLVEAPYLGMEHQSNIGYGNHFENGYKGRDLSHTGIGMQFDFIIVHESGHEWFGNNITSKDIADMWIHESFTNYSESLFIEYYWGKKEADEYIHGIRANISNDIPIIGHYGVNKEGSGDMYYKGANMIANIRRSIHNDPLFRSILQGLNKTFYHQTVDARQIESYINEHSKINFDKVFQQYLTTTEIPTLELEISEDNSTLKYRYTQCLEGFNMPLVLTDDNGHSFRLNPKTEWQKTPITNARMANILNPILIEQQYYLNCRMVH